MEDSRLQAGSQNSHSSRCDCVVVVGDAIWVLRRSSVVIRKLQGSKSFYRYDKVLRRREYETVVPVALLVYTTVKAVDSSCPSHVRSLPRRGNMIPVGV